MSESTDLKDAVDRLSGIIEQLRHDLVRKDVYAADQRLMSLRIDATDQDVKDLASRFDKAEDRDTANRRLLLTALVMPIIVLVITLYLTAQTGGAS